ncbi:hypothetical protein M514_13620 [Trichuris suis]|uniref:EGF-like domain-containing protein n=1 Tax=Trichuris suis TaxID=68888 RepID=A0A085NMG8_9BILA|nr:hypothetical protein M514_13620 [Trichuris suis]
MVIQWKFLLAMQVFIFFGDADVGPPPKGTSDWFYYGFEALKDVDRWAVDMSRQNPRGMLRAFGLSIDKWSPWGYTGTWTAEPSTFPSKRIVDLVTDPPITERTTEVPSNTSFIPEKWKEEAVSIDKWSPWGYTGTWTAEPSTFPSKRIVDLVTDPPITERTTEVPSNTSFIPEKWKEEAGEQSEKSNSVLIYVSAVVTAAIVTLIVVTVFFALRRKKLNCRFVFLRGCMKVEVLGKERRCGVMIFMERMASDHHLLSSYSHVLVPAVVPLSGMERLHWSNRCSVHQLSYIGVEDLGLFLYPPANNTVILTIISSSCRSVLPEMHVSSKLFILCLFSTTAVVAPDEVAALAGDSCPHEVSASHLGFRDDDGKCKTFATMVNAGFSTLDSADRYCAQKYKHGKLADFLNLDTLNQKFSGMARTKQFTIVNGITLELTGFSDVDDTGSSELRFKLLDYRWSKVFGLHYTYHVATKTVKQNLLVTLNHNGTVVLFASSGEFVSFNSSEVDKLLSRWPISRGYMFCSMIKEQNGKFRPVDSFKCEEWKRDTLRVGFFCSHDAYDDCSTNVGDCVWDVDKQDCSIVFKSREAEPPFGKVCDERSKSQLLHAVSQTCDCPFEIWCKYGILKRSPDGQYKCQCFHGYTGSACDTSENCTALSCHNAGHCVSPKGISAWCSCPPDYAGSFCERDFKCDSVPCQNGGTCTRDLRPGSEENSYCDCPYGFFGRYCQFKKGECENNLCANGSTCIPGTDMYKCACPKGIGGRFCRKVLPDCELECTNGGTCSKSDNVTKCVCQKGFTGDRCEIEMDACYNVTCQNGGTCMLKDDGGSKCVCPFGFIGLHCERAIREVCVNNMCSNDSTCRPLYDGYNYTCDCPPMKTGTYCDSYLLMCAKGTCKPNGKCMELNDGFECSCKPGFTGETCNEGKFLIGTCDEKKCFNAAQCFPSERNNTYTCICPPEFGGSFCDEKLGKCNRRSCRNDGVCRLNLANNTYYCDCPITHFGPVCESALPVCPQDYCYNDGKCILSQAHQIGYYCECGENFIGSQCAYATGTCDTHPCKNNSTCIPHGSAPAFRCFCADGFEGAFCDRNKDYCKRNLCRNGATCVSGKGNYTCKCNRRFTGRYCETLVLPCDRTPCMNGGNCTNSPNGRTFTCTCPQRFTGATCEEEINPCYSSPCPNTSVCMMADTDEGYTCLCGKLYTGKHCDQKIDLCANHSCANQATCQPNPEDYSYRCLCTEEYTGVHCETEADPCLKNLCQNNATCLPNLPGFGYNCSCLPLFQGQYCEYKRGLCDANKCANGATCTKSPDNEYEYMCKCPAYFSGKFCEKEIDPCQSLPCANGSTCLRREMPGQYDCICPPLYTGRHCESEVDPCLNHTCQNNATCTKGQKPGEYACVCPPFFTGEKCQTEIDPCIGHQCMNGGNCTAAGKPGEYVCLCHYPFTGKRCVDGKYL